MSEGKVPQIVAVGELLWDLLPSGARLGGAPANFAVFCARLGNRTVLVSSVGDDDYGRAARTQLVQPNLDLQQLQKSEPIPPERSKLHSLPITSPATLSPGEWHGISSGSLLACWQPPCCGCRLF